MPEIDASSQAEWLIIPGIEAWDELSGEPQDPAAANLPVLAAIGVIGGPKPADADYKPAEWVMDAPSPTARILLGTQGTLITPAIGTWWIYGWVQGVHASPRGVVGTLVVK